MINALYLYGLFDPRNTELRYLGVCENLKIRLRGHLKGARKEAPSPKCGWIRKLLSLELRPIIKPLALIAKDTWQETERECIKRAKKGGYDLTNVAEGGIGGSHNRQSLYVIAKNIRNMRKNKYALGNKMPREHIEKLRKIHTGKKKSPEHIRKIVEAGKKYRETHGPRKMSLEERKRRGEAQKRRFQRPEEIENVRQRTAGKNNPMYGRKRDDIKRNPKGQFLKKDMAMEVLK